MTKSKHTSGFVYIWYDRKHKRYYVGSHWGSQYDAYVCSSGWMMSAYGRRPLDFKRRILKTVTGNRNDLLREEHRWLQMIKPEEMGQRYYNRMRSADWKDGVLRDAKIAGAKKGRPLSEEHRAALREAAKTRKPQSAEAAAKRSESLKRAHAEGRHAGMRGKKASWKDPNERAKKISESLLGKPLSDDHRQKILDSGFGQHWVGKTRSDETRAKMAEARKKWWAEKKASREHPSLLDK